MKVSEIKRAQTTPIVVVDPEGLTMDCGEQALRIWADCEVSGLWMNAGRLVVVIDPE